MGKDFKLKQLVWAKMRGFPYWPARISFPSDGKMPKTKKAQHYVHFFGTYDYAWMLDNFIVPHSKKMLENTKSYKKISKSLQIAIKQIQIQHRKILNKRKRFLKRRIKKEPLEELNITKKTKSGIKMKNPKKRPASDIAPGKSGSDASPPAKRRRKTFSTIQIKEEPVDPDGLLLQLGRAPESLNRIKIVKKKPTKLVSYSKNESTFQAKKKRKRVSKVRVKKEPIESSLKQSNTTKNVPSTIKTRSCKTKTMIRKKLTKKQSDDIVKGSTSQTENKLKKSHEVQVKKEPTESSLKNSKRLANAPKTPKMRPSRKKSEIEKKVTKKISGNFVKQSTSRVENKLKKPREVQVKLEPVESSLKKSANASKAPKMRPSRNKSELKNKLIKKKSGNLVEESTSRVQVKKEQIEIFKISKPLENVSKTHTMSTSKLVNVTKDQVTKKKSGNLVEELTSTVENIHNEVQVKKEQIESFKNLKPLKIVPKLHKTSISKKKNLTKDQVTKKLSGNLVEESTSRVKNIHNDVQVKMEQIKTFQLSKPLKIAPKTPKMKTSKKSGTKDQVTKKKAGYLGAVADSHIESPRRIWPELQEIMKTWKKDSQPQSTREKSKSSERTTPNRKTVTEKETCKKTLSSGITSDSNIELQPSRLDTNLRKWRYLNLISEQQLQQLSSEKSSQLKETTQVKTKVPNKTYTKTKEGKKIKSEEVASGVADKKFKKYSQIKKPMQVRKVSKKIIFKSEGRKMKREVASGMADEKIKNVNFKNVKDSKFLEDSCVDIDSPFGVFRGYGPSTSSAQPDFFSDPGPSTSSGYSRSSSPPRPPPSGKTVGFLGMGRIGSIMVKHLLRANHTVIIWNRSMQAASLSSLRSEGALLAEFPADVICMCDVTFCCVSNAEASKNVIFLRHGVLDGFNRLYASNICNRGYVELSSIDPTTSEEISEAITDVGARYLEAPLLGTVPDAEAKDMVILAGGDHDLFLECKTFFDDMTRHAQFIGNDIGCAYKTSIIAENMMGSAIAALGEVVELAKKCGCDPEIFIDALKSGPMNCPLIIKKAIAMFKGSSPVETPLKHQQKNMTMALSLFDNQPLTVSAQANEVYKHAARLYPDFDISYVTRYYQ